MTNKDIILSAAVQLVKEGRLKSTGRVFSYTDASGAVHLFPEPETIHTFQKWKELGYSVRRGERSDIKIRIWKYTGREKEVEDQLVIVPGKMIMKTACFFRADQVQKI